MFGKKKDDGYLPKPVPYDSLNAKAQRQRRAETDPILRQQILDEERSWREAGY